MHNSNNFVMNSPGVSVKKNIEIFSMGVSNFGISRGNKDNDWVECRNTTEMKNNSTRHTERHCFAH